MPEAETPPVFINQTADYQQAAAKLSQLANYQAPLAAAAQELGLGNELQQTKDALNNLKGQAQVLQANEMSLAVQGAQVDADNARAHHSVRAAENVIGTGTAVAGAVMAANNAKGWKVLKAAGGALAGAVAGTLATLGVSSLARSGSTARKNDTVRAQIANQMQENRVTYEAVALQNNFIDQMATRMVEQQKALEGEGADMKLVSTAQAAQAPSMAEKYAAAPAESKAAAVAEQQAAAAMAQAR